LGPAATGIYNAAKRLLVAISLVMSSGLNSVALPLLASLSDDSEQLKDSFLKCVGFTVLITSPIFAGLAVLSPDVIGILMGDRWSDVAPVLSILCIAGFLSSFLQYSTNILLIRRKAHWITLVSLFEALINLLILVVVARHGIIYLALAFVTKSILLSPIMVLLSINIIDLKFLQYWKVIFMPILLSIAMAGIILFLKMHTQFSSLVNLLIMIPFGAILYIALSFIMNKKIFLTMLNVMIKSIKK
jgi:teichuronic acid exporter